MKIHYTMSITEAEEKLSSLLTNAEYVKAGEMESYSVTIDNSPQHGDLVEGSALAARNKIPLIKFAREAIKVYANKHELCNENLGLAETKKFVEEYFKIQ